MSKYIVHRTVNYTIELDADSVEDAIEKACEADEDDFDFVCEDDMVAELLDEEAE